MKVAFLKPPVGGILGLEMLTFVEPLGPICVAACVEQDGHECAVFDLRIDGDELSYSVRMGAVGQPMQHHLAALLHRKA